MLGFGAVVTVAGIVAVVLVTLNSSLPSGTTREAEFYTGLTLVASIGILIFAIAAAIYTRPTYEDWKESQRPIVLELRQLRIRDFCGKEALCAKGVDELPTKAVTVAQDSGSLSTRVTVNVTMINSGTRPTKYLANLFVPLPCELEMTEAPAVRHIVSETTKVSSFTADHEARFSWKEDTVFDDTTFSLAADVLIPTEAPSWVSELGGWPMCVVVQYERKKFVARWSVLPGPPTGSPDEALEPTVDESLWTEGPPDETLGVGIA